MQFYIVYIKEAHPVDGWRTRGNDRSGIKVKQPKTEKERRAVASTCVKKLKLTLPTLLDDMKNSTDGKYSGWPDRLFVIDHEGKVSFKCAPGPRGFDPKSWEKGIAAAVKKAPPLKKKKTAKKSTKKDGKDDGAKKDEGDTPAESDGKKDEDETPEKKEEGGK